jgi:hypothetical protein
VAASLLVVFEVLQLQEGFVGSHRCRGRFRDEKDEKDRLKGSGINKREAMQNARSGSLFG